MEPWVVLVLWTLFTLAVATLSAGLDYWLCQRWRKCQKRYSPGRLVARFMVIFLLMVVFAISVGLTINSAVALFTIL